jgi:endo-beta-N-acetylglucosaminidase D
MMNFIHVKFTFVVLFGIIFFTNVFAQKGDGEHQPYASYWFINELLEWNPETDKNTKFNVSHVPLRDRFTDTNTQIRPELSTEPSIISLIAPHPTNSHPSQGFQTIEQYAFPYWQYIDYMVQWGGSAQEGIIVTPTVFWIESAHLNGVQILGTVFFPPNVYGGKEEWVREFLVKDAKGNFPVADKLIQVAKLYGFEGWFINQETNGMTKKEADAMQEFLKYYQKKAADKLKIMWYDAMIEDGRVIWQDEFNHHNSMYFQNENEKVSDIMFIDFGWSETQLEDSHKRAIEKGRSPWEIFSGIDVQAKSYKTPTNWAGLYKNEKPYTTSIGLYCPNTTFDIAKNKQPESVYEEEQKFWNGTILKEEVPAWQSKEWKGFSKYIPARSVINQIPFVTNFNYGLGRFYNEKGKQLSNNQWHNLSNQDILPTWQWQVDTTLVNVNFDFNDSYTGGSSIKISAKKSMQNITVPLYKTALEITHREEISIVAKGTGKLNLVAFTNDGLQHVFPVSLKSEWTNTMYSLAKLKGRRIIKIELNFIATTNDAVTIGELAVKKRKPIKIRQPKVEISSFVHGNKAELYVHIQADERAEYHNIYQVSGNEKIWLGKTKSSNYYVASVNKKANQEKAVIQVISVAKDGTKSKVSKSTFYWK